MVIGDKINCISAVGENVVWFETFQPEISHSLKQRIHEKKGHEKL